MIKVRLRLSKSQPVFLSTGRHCGGITMKYAKIGGQAVMEGIMMRNGEDYAVAVRKPNKEIEIKKDTYKGIVSKLHWNKIPILRGVAAFIDSLVLGMSTLTYSASFYDDEEDDEVGVETTTEKSWKDTLFMTITVVIAVLLAVGLFMALPYFASNLFSRWISSQGVLALIEGVLRILIFLTYIILISRMKDIQRVFMYHGAEHKTINCIEHGEELTVENAAKYSRLHKRCGTSFLLIVVLLCVIVHIVFFALVPIQGTILKFIIRLLLIPIIAGLSYELLQWLGRHDSVIVNILSKPGFLMQKLTTREPDPDMLEVAIASIEAIYDWREFQEEVKDQTIDKKVGGNH